MVFYYFINIGNVWEIVMEIDIWNWCKRYICNYIIVGRKSVLYFNVDFGVISIISCVSGDFFL